MNHPREVAPSRLSRRAVVGSAGALGLALATQRLKAAAQDATPAASPATVPFSRAGHPLIGTWLVDTDPANPGDDITTAIVDADGTYLTYDPFAGVGIGLWRATGGRTAELVFSFQRLAGSQNLTTLEAVFAPDYVPTGHAFEADVATVRLTIAVAATADTMTLDGPLEVRGADGTVIYNDIYQGIGTRMAPVATAEAATPTA